MKALKKITVEDKKAFVKDYFREVTVIYMKAFTKWRETMQLLRQKVEESAKENGIQFSMKGMFGLMRMTEMGKSIQELYTEFVVEPSLLDKQSSESIKAIERKITLDQNSDSVSISKSKTLKRSTVKKKVSKGMKKEIKKGRGQE